jgi:hypothetical protein
MAAADVAPTRHSLVYRAVSWVSAFDFYRPVPSGSSFRPVNREFQRRLDAMEE